MAKQHPPETRALAAELRAAGTSYKGIAAQLGVGLGTVHRWLKPDTAERDRRKASEWKARNPERNKAITRAFHRSGMCPECGGTMFVYSDMCRACRRSQWEDYLAIVAIAYIAGDGWREMADHFGKGSTGAISALVFHARSLYGFPHRYDDARVAAITAGTRGRWAA